MPTVVAHAVQVGRARDIGLGGQQAAVGKLAHAQGVGQLDPLEGVDVDAEVPAVQGLRIQPDQQREVADDHQALDVVGVGVLERLADGARQAGHAGATRPEPLGQRQPVPEVVALVVAGHVRPVDPAHVLAPAQDLADEALRGGQGRTALAPRVFRCVDDLARLQHLHVQGEGQQRVKEPAGALAQGVLEVAEMGQGVLDEGRQVRAGLVGVQWPGQAIGLRVAERGDASVDDGLPEFAVVVRRTPVCGLWRLAGPGLAVVGVEVPLATLGLAVGGHQHAMLAAHVPVEVLHQPLLAACEEPRRFVSLGEEVLGVDLLHVQSLGPAVLRPPFQGLVQAPFIRALIDHGVGLMVVDEGVEVGRDALAVAGVVDGDVAHAVALGAQVSREGPHRGEDGKHLLGVVKHVRGFLPDLHEHVNDVRVDLLKPAVGGVELITQDQAQRGHESPHIRR